MEQKHEEHNRAADFNIRPLPSRKLVPLKGAGQGGRDPWPQMSPNDPPVFCSCAEPMSDMCGGG